MTDAASTRPRAPLGATSWPALVGRESELQELTGAIRFGTATVISGDPGVGKTRLASEGIAWAGAQGYDTARAVASRSASNIPLGCLAALVPAAPTPDLRHDAVRHAVDALVSRAEERPFVLLVDDAHSLDDASATVLQHVSTDSDVRLVVTVRGGEQVPEPVASLWKDELAVRIDLEPLTRDEVEQLLSAALGGSVDAATVGDLYQSSQGNPLVLRELMFAALDSEFLVEDGVWRLTDRLRASARLVELVEARLADLSEAERSALEIVAFGEPVPVDLLATMVAAADLERLERAGLIAVAPGPSRGDVSLAHPVHGEVLRELAPTLGAMAVQQRLAEATQAHGPLTSDDVVRVAVWTLEAGGTLDPGIALEAARRAYFAHDDRLVERLAVVAHQGGAGFLAPLLLGQALYRTKRYAESLAALVTAETVSLNDTNLALVALQRAEVLFTGLRRADDAHATLEAAEVEVGEEARGELTAMRSVYRLLEGRLADAVALGQPLLQRGAGRAFAVAATGVGPALAVMGRAGEALDLAESAFPAHLELGDQEVLGDASIHMVIRALALGELGRLADAESTARAVYDGALSARFPDGQAWGALLLGRSLWMSRPHEALRWFRLSASLFGELGLTGQRRWALAGATLAAATTGDSDVTAALLDAIEDDPANPVRMMASEVERARAWAAITAGDFARGARTFEQAARMARESGALALEAAVLHDMARVTQANTAVERLDELCGQTDGAFMAARAAHARALGADDGGALEDAASAFSDLGALVLAAEAFAQASAAWRRARQRRHAQRCVQRAGDLADRAGGVDTPAMRLAGSAAVLTQRELEIATLAAERRTSREIADQLYLSVRTVENHLQRAYEKLGITRREELADALTRQRDLD